MANFYTWPRFVCYAITFALALGVLSQATALVLSYFRYPRNRKWVFDTLLELFLLCHLYTIALIHGWAMNGFGDALYIPLVYGTQRLACFAAVALVSVTIAVTKRQPEKLLIIVACGLTLPVTEQLCGIAFAYMYTLAAMFWLMRAVSLCVARHRSMRLELSSLSVKNAIDSLNTGVMFCESDGFIVLINSKMQRLMSEITGKVFRNGRKFYGALTLGDIDPRCRTTWLEGANVTILPDGSAWKFALSEMLINKKVYTQITATDITEAWELTAQLQPQNEELKRRQDELSETIANLHILSRERETQRAKMRAHDILGERLTLMLRAIRNEQTPDYALLRSLSHGMIDELKAVDLGPEPRDEIDVLKQTFSSIGVTVETDGDLPNDTAKGQLFADIIREAVTNAVRHGLATQVNIHMESTEAGYLLRVEDNGHGTADPVKEGGGLSGMREKLKPFSGTLSVSAAPHFVLIVDIPTDSGGAADV